MKTIATRVTPILVALLTMVLISTPATAATAPTLGTLGRFAVLAGETVTNTGPTVIDGSLGVSPGSAATGFPPGVVNAPGTIHTADANAGQAQTELTTAYNTLAGEECLPGNNLTGQDLGGLTLVPGTYCFDSSAFLTGTLTLNTQGNPDSVFVFQMGSTLITASNSGVEFINGGTCSLFWQVGSSATLGTETQFKGSILALASITAVTGATVEGRLLARNGEVTLDSNTVNSSTCAPVDSSTPAPAPSPTLTTTTPPTSSTPTTPVVSPSTPAPIVVGPDTVIPTGAIISPEEIVFPDVPGATGTTTGVTSPDNPSTVDQPVTFTATVVPNGSGVPTGLVTFIDNSTALGTVPVDDRGRATFTTSSLTPGDHRITVVYHGGPGFSGSKSQVLIQRVKQPVPVTKIVTSTQQLVSTGINALPIGLSGGAALLLGAGLLVEERRRAKKRSAMGTAR